MLSWQEDNHQPSLTFSIVLWTPQALPFTVYSSVLYRWFTNKPEETLDCDSLHTLEPFRDSSDIQICGTEGFETCDMHVGSGTHYDVQYVSLSSSSCQPFQEMHSVVSCPTNLQLMQLFFCSVGCWFNSKRWTWVVLCDPDSNFSASSALHHQREHVAECLLLTPSLIEMAAEASSGSRASALMEKSSVREKF